jgi:phosphatidylserine decarboxylase
VEFAAIDVLRATDPNAAAYRLRALRRRIYRREQRRLERLQRVRLMRRQRRDGAWTFAPHPFARQQKVALAALAAAAAAFFLILLIIIFSWHIVPYRVVSRDGTAIEEPTPVLTAKSLQFLYAFPAFGTALRMQGVLSVMTDQCGTMFSKSLGSTGAREGAIYDDWINVYHVNMSDYEPPSWADYSSVNAWFTRALRPGARPLPASSTAISNPADGRVLIYRALLDSETWVKMQPTTAAELTGNLVVDGRSDYFRLGAMVITRLAPHDYHRFHAPAAATVLSVTTIDGTYWSVGSEAARSRNLVFLNTRKVLLLDAGRYVGKIAFIAIGATCIGSVVVQREDGTPLQAGDAVDRGEQLGFMQFGGSTVVMLFERGRVLFDEDIVFRSRFPVETYVPVNAAIGDTVTD